MYTHADIYIYTHTHMYIDSLLNVYVCTYTNPMIVMKNLENFTGVHKWGQIKWETYWFLSGKAILKKSANYPDLVCVFNAAPMNA